MREIVLDTETTGINPFEKPKNRIVEIGCVELINRVATGEIYHQYINPERDMPEGAFRVHGLSEEFLGNHPVFKEIAGDFLNFIGDSQMIIHNASFDMKFLNAELEWINKAQLPMSQATDTLAMARLKFPGAQASLDALCRRYEIDNSSRTYHGALLDSELLAEVYLELTGGRQPGLLGGSDDGENTNGAVGLNKQASARVNKPMRPARPHFVSNQEIKAHEEFLEKITDPIWHK